VPLEELPVLEEIEGLSLRPEVDPLNTHLMVLELDEAEYNDLVGVQGLLTGEETMDLEGIVNLHRDCFICGIKMDKVIFQA
jgi:hypothetical protein